MRVLSVVIGNNSYFKPDALANAINDARAMENVFIRLGYAVLPGYDCHNEDYENILRTLDQDLKNFDASIFYYAGHGFQEGGENYLPSIDCQISFADKYSLSHNSIMLSDLLDIYRKHSHKTHIVILDACRQRPSRGGGGDSFAPVNAPKGTIIAFSTSPNCPAMDSSGGEHSVYTQALLSYIGRERLMVEDLFKKVRRTVAQWTHETQIPWEHTSLIGDFCFNSGQMIVAPQIPYRDDVVKDSEYDEQGQIADFIRDIKILDYNRQNHAIDRLWAMRPDYLDKNQQFIFGRNLLQSSDMSFSAQRFMNSLATNLRKYSMPDGDNHVLNGILFEIYFDSHGEFRSAQIKRNSYFDVVMSLRVRDEFSKSFGFIRAAIYPYRDDLIYLIPEDNAKLDVDILLKEEVKKDGLGNDEVFSVISAVTINGISILDSVRNKLYYSDRGLLEAVALSTNAPIDAIALHPNIPLRDKISFVEKDVDPFA